MPSIDDASVAVALGANRPSAAGSPRETLVAVRPLLEDLLRVWSDQELVCRWSSLHDTAPVGGPPDQPSLLQCRDAGGGAASLAKRGLRTAIAG